MVLPLDVWDLTSDAFTQARFCASRATTAMGIACYTIAMPESFARKFARPSPA